ncbi:hypothetical protein ACFLW1_03370 [Chloroflexota bacterium]
MVREYILLAVGCVAVGVALTFILITWSLRVGLDITGDYIWVLAIPAIVSIMLNILLLELYHKFRGKK